MFGGGGEPVPDLWEIKTPLDSPWHLVSLLFARLWRICDEYNLQKVPHEIQVRVVGCAFAVLYSCAPQKHSVRACGCTNTKHSLSSFICLAAAAVQ